MGLVWSWFGDWYGIRRECIMVMLECCRGGRDVVWAGMDLVWGW